jgi:hypothetical protein
MPNLPLPKPVCLFCNLSELLPQEQSILYGLVTDLFLFAVTIGRAHVVIHHPEAGAQITVYQCCNQDGRNLFLAYSVSMVTGTESNSRSFRGLLV